VTFAPNASGAASGQLTFKASTSGITATESVSGTGAPRKTYTVHLTWDPSTSKVTGYNIYRGTTSGGPYSKLNSRLDGDTSYVDSTVSAGHTYYYVARAVNSRGEESTNSNQARVEIP
jgi:fibronectin type 3 domain-containing protein